MKSDSKKYDYIIVGAGFFGSICAYELNKAGKSVVVLEKRDHVGGNCYTEKINEINVHKYGPHIFHTNEKWIWDWINQFADFNGFKYNPIANYKGKLYSLPFSMFTFNQMWGVTTPNEAKQKIDEQRYIGHITNLEEQALSLVGKDIYEKLIKGYTEKQWRKSATELPPSIIKRLPVRFTWDNNYYFDKYQGIPIGGYTQIFEKLLDGIKVYNNVDYLENKEYWDELADKVIYTGPIDKYFNYQFGDLEYKSVYWLNSNLPNVDNYQGCAGMNYTDIETPFTRVIEHKHFDNQNQKGTYVSWEYPQEYKRGVEPFYPVNDEENNEKYRKYKQLADNDKVIFGGRLAEYKYYDMHQVIASALNIVKNLVD
jgi:UDP-galactopyranose mutase